MNKECVGIILAGGKSRRFGQNKAWVKVPPLANPLSPALSPEGRRRQKSFIEHLYQLHSSVFEKTYVVLHEVSPSFSQMNVILDRYPEGGPMNGICSALEATQAPAIFVTAVDLPLLQIEDIKTLLNQWKPECPALVYQRQGHWEPLCGIYNASLIPAFQKSIQLQKFSLQQFLTQHQAKGIGYDPKGGKDHLRNINTLEDWEFLKE